MLLQLESLVKSIHSLSDALERTENKALMEGFDSVTKNTLRAGVIQNFEFTYELCWKFMKRWLEVNLGSDYVLGLTRRALFRLAAEYKLINSVEQWMEYHQGRNLTSHTYNLDTADEVYDITVQFLPDAKRLLKQLEENND